MNAIYMIRPYLAGKTWCFTDAERGLLAEAFVGDTNRLISGIAAGQREFVLLFSVWDFPGHTHHFVRVREQSGGWWYADATSGDMGWLCPAMFKYYDVAPLDIYAASGV